MSVRVFVCVFVFTRWLVCPGASLDVQQASALRSPQARRRSPWSLRVYQHVHVVQCTCGCDFAITINAGSSVCSRCYVFCNRHQRLMLYTAAVVLRKSVEITPRGRPSCLSLLVEVCAIVVYGPYSIVDFCATISDADPEAVFCPPVGGHATSILMPFSDCRLGAVFRHAWRRPVRRS